MPIRSLLKEQWRTLKIERPLLVDRDSQLLAGMLALLALASFVLGRTGGFSGGPVPDPISNSAVNLPSADGTKSQDLEE